MWIEKLLPNVCSYCRKEIRRREFEKVLYFTHPNCYWNAAKTLRSFPIYLSKRELSSSPIKDVALDCLHRVQGMEVTDGCSHSCIFCYTYSPPRLGLPRGVVIKRTNILTKLKNQVRKMKRIRPIYLCPNSDPFQKGVTEAIIEDIIRFLVEKELSFYFITKGVIPRNIIDLINGYPYVDVQLTLITSNDEKRRLTEPNAPPIRERLKNIENLVNIGLHPIQRIDPLFPYLTDDHLELEDLIEQTIGLGVRHVIGSYGGLRGTIWRYMRHWLLINDLEDVVKKIELLFFKKHLYQKNFFIADEKYRFHHLKWLGDTVKRIGKGNVTYTTCLEDTFEKEIFQRFWTTPMCEPIYLPMMKKESGKFRPISQCLSCNQRGCNGCTFAENTKKDLIKFLI